MASRPFDGVRFVVFSNDHPLRHVHAFVAEAQIIIDLRPDGVALADRRDAIQGNAKRPDVKKALITTADHFDELVALWEGVHGNA